MTLTGKRVLFVIPPGNFRDEEFEIPYNTLTEHGAEVSTASTLMKKASGMFGAEVMPDLTIYEVDTWNYDAVVFIGGSGSSIYFDDPTAHKIAREAVNGGKVVAAICIAPATLANAGLLANKRATASESVAQIIQRSGAMHTGTSIQRDGMILTGIGPTAAKQFADELVSMLGDRE